MQQAAGAWGIELSELKRAKGGGCLGFQHGRVNREAVEEWLKNNPKVNDVKTPDAGKVEKEKDPIKQARLELLQLELEDKRGGRVSLKDVKAGWGVVIESQKQVLEKHLTKAQYNAVMRDMRQAISQNANRFCGITV